MSEEIHVVEGVDVDTLIGHTPRLSSVVTVTINSYDEQPPAAYAMTARDAEVLGMALLDSAKKLHEQPPPGQAFYKTIRVADQPTLLPWLEKAAQEIAVMDTTVRPHARPLYVVEVNNGFGGHEGAGSYLAWCNDTQTAELVAAGLWALLGQDRRS